MQIVVNDTNIFIDLINAELIEPFFLLPFEVHTTDFIIQEIEEEEQEIIIQQLIENGRLTVSGLDVNEIEEIISLQESIRQLSIPDCSVWYYSKKNNYTLVSGDGLLRKSAINDGVDVRGILFIFDELIRLGLINLQLAAEKLELLLQTGSRLPKNECEERLIRWRS